MSWLSDLTGIDINVGNIVDGFTGKAAAEAATDSAAVQQAAANAAAGATADATQQQIGVQQDALSQANQYMQPFTQFGASFMDPTQQAVAQSQQLFGPNASDAIMNNPMFQALLDQSNTNIMQNAAVSGRLGTGGTQQHLQDAALRTGFDVLNQERSASLQNANFLAGLVGQGQNAANTQGSYAMNTGANIANTIGQGNALQQDFLTSGSAANAAGMVGAANAYGQGAQNIVGLGTSLFGLPNFGAG